MRFRLFLPLLALLAVAVTAMPSAADAKSRYKVGFGDQNAQIFADPNFASLKIKRVRYIVSWNYATNKTFDENAEVANWINTARAQRKEVMVAFNAPRGCYDNGKYSKSKYCRAPSPAAFQKAFKNFRKQFPFVKIIQPWNEINSKSQPTAKNPKRAAQYYNVAKKNCKGCTVLAADLLDSSNIFRYLAKMKKTLKGSPKYWGLHNYADVNRTKNKGKFTKGLMKRVPGQVWLTETGGLVKFERNFPYSPSRANKATRNMFKLADQLSKKRRGYRSRVLRVYPYTYYGETRDKRFDAGIVGPLADPKPRPAFKTFKKLVKSRSK